MTRILSNANNNNNSSSTLKQRRPQTRDVHVVTSTKRPIDSTNPASCPPNKQPHVSKNAQQQQFLPAPSELVISMTPPCTGPKIQPQSPLSVAASSAQPPLVSAQASASTPQPATATKPVQPTPPPLCGAMKRQQALLQALQPNPALLVLDLQLDEHVLSPLGTKYEQDMYDTWLTCVDNDSRTRFGAWIPKITRKDGDAALISQCLLQGESAREELIMLDWMRSFCGRMQRDRCFGRYTCVKAYFKAVCMMYRYLRSPVSKPIYIGRLMFLAVACLNVAMKCECDTAAFSTVDLIRKLGKYYGQRSQIARGCSAHHINLMEAALLEFLDWDVAYMPDMLDVLVSNLRRCSGIEKEQIPEVTSECMLVLRRSAFLGLNFSFKEVVNIALCEFLSRTNALPAVVPVMLIPCDVNSHATQKRLDFVIKKRYGHTERV